MDHAVRPSYSDLSPEQKAALCNGVGSGWMPRWSRSLLTQLSGWFFDEASWCHHDFGYAVGYTEQHRLEYDRKFLDAMLHDCRELRGVKRGTAVALSYTFYASVWAFGRFSFVYGERYRTLDELL